jgi:hypothetical protein
LSTANEKLEELREFKESLIVQSKLIREDAGKDVLIDGIRLDDEAIRTPKLHNRWLSELSEAAYSFKKIKNSQKKLELERWKYYMGKQTDQYYVIYGIPHEKSLKTDLDKYLGADDFLIEMNEIVEIQAQCVEFLEKTVKDISNRGFAIKNCIDWRRFEAGS